MAKAVGIDLGTTNSVIAFMDGDRPVVIPNQEGKRTTPSVVAYKKDGEILVGELAKRQAVANSDKTFFSVKRFIGKNYEEAKEVIESLPYKNSIKAKGHHCVIQVDNQELYPQQISAQVLMKLKKAAEDYLGEEVKDAVITVPAYFNDAQRNATKEAGAIAGLNVIRIINEPTAAALAYGIDKEIKNGKVAVFDLGGGTFDISILEISDGVFEVLATSGDTNLGGDNFDEMIINYIVQEIKSKYNHDVTKDIKAMQRIKEAAENAKIELSAQSQTEINLPYLFIKDGNVCDYQTTITRTQFEEMCSHLYERIKEPCYKAIKQANVSSSDIDSVILVGGSTRMPRVRQLVKEIFGKEPKADINPDEAVALGAAIQAGVLKGDVKDILLLDVIPISLCIEANGGLAIKMIEAGTTIPTKHTEIFTTVTHNQRVVEVHVLQGERPMAADNKSLGRFLLDGIPPAPAGVPRIEVTFDVDANGILTVTARDEATGRSQSIRIEGSTRLPDNEIERMRREAEENKEKDAIRKKKAELKNELHGIKIHLEKTKQESQLNEEDKVKIDELINRISNIENEEDVNKMESSIRNLQTELYQVMALIQSRKNQNSQSVPQETVS